jgi:2-polyprenyl-6-methoxyphenol hydroxylase-like FAD-dependent oxidoreductase
MSSSSKITSSSSSTSTTIRNQQQHQQEQEQQQGQGQGHDLPIIVVGGGLAGCMTALLLSKHQNTNIIVLEHREDFRIKQRLDEDKFTSSLKRSINLALSYRGISALKRANVFEHVEKALIPMRGRVVHLLDGKSFSFNCFVLSSHLTAHEFNAPI